MNGAGWLASAAQLRWMRLAPPPLQRLASTRSVARRSRTEPSPAAPSADLDCSAFHTALPYFKFTVLGGKLFLPMGAIRLKRHFCADKTLPKPPRSSQEYLDLDTSLPLLELELYFYRTVQGLGRPNNLLW